jgi:hypothetical protein
MDASVKAMFAAKMRAEDNRMCADCAERNPKWASVGCVCSLSLLAADT